jgi:hypothetical protein
MTMLNFWLVLFQVFTDALLGVCAKNYAVNALKSGDDGDTLPLWKPLWSRGGMRLRIFPYE